MVNIGDVTLKIIEGPFEGPPPVPEGKALIRVIYSISTNEDDAVQGKSYREQVQLFGDDRGEGGTRNLIPGPDGIIVDRILVFPGSIVDSRHEEKMIDISLLDEDSHPFMRKEDEIGAVVIITQLTTVTRESNIVKRGGFIDDEDHT